ncbi:MAG: TauD/TfdA family dioxygenase [Granulosicoccus sp.]
MHISLEAECLTVHWADDTVSAYPYLWLRDTDPAGFHPQTGERTFDLTSVPPYIEASSASIDADTLVVNWSDRTAPSRFPVDWIRRHQPGNVRDDPAHVIPRHWRAGTQRTEHFQADDLLASSTTLSEWLLATKRDGLSIVEGLANSAQAGKSIAERVGQLRRTNFGTTFEVISKSDPNNLAYTAEALPLHTDLTNQELPPGYQFLHCLANEASGGGSLFCDGFAVASDLQNIKPDYVDRLARVTVPFRFHDSDTDIRARKHVITRNTKGQVNEICFNAHLADILDLDADELSPYYAAYRAYMAMTRSSEYVVNYRLKAGEMVVFDNRRVLHGRQAFEPGTGHRHLHGCYVDRADWDSRIRMLS